MTEVSVKLHSNVTDRSWRHSNVTGRSVPNCVSKLSSIIKKGLIPAGTGGIVPPYGHVPLGTSSVGIDNWAATVFVSPSKLHASQNVYSPRIWADGQKWCCLVKPYCKNGHYTEHRSTVRGFNWAADTHDHIGQNFVFQQQIIKTYFFALNKLVMLLFTQ